MSPQPSEALVSKTDGLHMSRSGFGTYYGCTTSNCADSDAQISSAIAASSIAVGTRTQINFDNSNAATSDGVTTNSDDFHLVYRGYFYAETTRTYYFGTSSDDMSYVWLGSSAVSPTYSNATVKNQGLHGNLYASGSVTLQGGKWHPILILFGERGGGAVINFYWSTSSITSQPSTVSTLSASNFRHSGQVFFTSISNPGTPSTADDANTDLIASNSYVTNKSSISFTGTTTANSYVEYSWSTSSGTPSSATGQCSVSSTTYTCNISGYTGDTRYLRVRAYDDYSNISSWTTAVQVEGKVLASTDIVGGALDKTFPVQPQVQLKFAGGNQALAGVNVTATVSSGATLLGTTTVTTDSSGLAVFTDLGFDSGTIGSDYTITYSASGYLSASDTARIRPLATAIYISTSASTNGSFVDGVWLADSQAPSIINASDLASQLAQRNIILEAAYTSATSTTWSEGMITLDTALAVNLASERILTLKATKNVYFNEENTLAATGAPLNLVVWSDSDGTNGGGVYLRASTAEFTVATNGGDVAIGGGVNSEVWNGLTVPAGYSHGNSAYTGSWWGVEFGVNQAIATRKLISTSGGSLRVRGEGNSATSALYGVAWEGGEINTGSGSVTLDGKVIRDSNPTGGPTFGVGLGANNDGSNDFPKLVTSGSVTITGSTAGAYAGHQGVYIGNADLDAGASTITISSDRRAQFGAANTVRSPIDLDVAADVSVTAAQSWTAGADLSCSSGNFSNSSTGTITSGGDLTIQCSSLTTAGLISSAGDTLLAANGASGTTTISAGVEVTQLGKNLTLKAASNVLIDNDLSLQTAGRAAGAGGNLILWSDSDGSGQGFIRTKQNVTMNTIGGSTTTYVGGGHIQLAGGLDDGSTSISESAQAGDGLPDGWAISTSSTEFGIQIGLNATSATVSRFHSGGGDVRMFGRATSASDGVAHNWATVVDSGEGQIEIQGSSTYWGLQLNRAGDANTFSTKSSITSRSDSQPAILLKGYTSGPDMGLLGSWGDTGSDNLTIQSLGDGGINLIGQAPNSSRAGIGFASSAILSAAGPIKIDGGTKGIHLGILVSGHSQGSVVIGSCAVSTCSNSLVTSSSANLEVIGDRITTFGSLSTTVNTSGTAKFLPAVGSTAFTDFQSRTSGLTLNTQLGGLEIGRSGDTTSAMRIQNNWTIAGPITVHAAQIYVDQDLRTTGSGSSPITLRSLGQVYTNQNVDLVTNGSDVVFWSGANESAGSPSNTIYISDGSTITTNGGKIWLAGGLDDGGANAFITSDRGKWSTVIAGDGLPDGYATGENSSNEWDHGVRLGSASKLLSDGGDIFIAGSAGPSSSGYAHIALYPGAQVDSGTGRIAMWGRSFTGHTTQGIAMPWGDNSSPVMVTSNATTSDAISIYSDSSAGASWSRGIIAYWYGALDAARGYQGSQILATASGGGITMTGISSATGNTSDGPNGLYLDFIDIMAIDGPITLNGDGGSSGWSIGTAFGWRNNPSAAVRLGGWAKGDTTANGGGTITTPSGVTADFTNSASDVTINTDSFWNRQSGNGMLGIYVATTGDFKILPSQLANGIISPADSFNYTQNSLDWSFEKLRFPVTPESIQIGKSATSTAITVSPELRAHGAISVYGSTLSFPSSITSESGRGPILLKSTSSITLAANKTYQTNGSDLALWSGSTGGTGTISIPNGACLNTNASCDTAASVATGNIYLGGGSAGTTYPTGPANGGSSIGISIGTGVNSGVKILSGGGDISLKGSSTGSHGNSSWSGLTMVATSGSIYSEGTTSAAGVQGLRVAETGATTISSGKTSGDAIKLVGTNSSNSATGASYGVGFLGTSMAINATGGGHIRIESSHGVTSIPSTRLERVTATASGGNIYLTSTYTDLVSSNLSATAGGSIQVKSSLSNYIESSTIQTAGPAGSGMGAISLWSDSDGNDTGVFNSAGVICINTIGSCSTPALNGGGDIVIGGGAASDVSGFFPTGGSPASTTNQGIMFGNAHAAGRVKLYSGGGDISIRSKTTSGAYQGQYWHAGTTIDSGTGAISIENAAGATSNSEQYAVWIQSQSADISITSAKPTGTAISFNVVSGFQSTNWSSALLFWNENTSGKTIISAPGGGDIEISATANGTGANKYSVDMNNVDVLASSGDITIGGNRGVWINRGATGKLVTLGATSAGSATGDIVLRGNRYGQGSGPLAVKTTGTLTIEPLAGGSFLEDVSFPNAATALTGLTGLTVGGTSNTAGLTVATAATIAGPISYQGGAITQSAALTSSTSSISIQSSSTVALNADLTASSAGILVKSVGRISTSGGASAAAPRSLGTAAGPITLWTTGADAGVTLSNFTKIDTTLSGTAGADITIGGGTPDVQDPSLPSGKATSSTSTGVLLGSSDALDNFVVRAGSGAFNVRGESTLASASASGVRLFSGANIQAGTVEMVGKGLGTATANNTASGLYIYGPSAIKTVIEATASFSEHTEALVLDSEMTNGTFATLLGNGSSTSVADFLTVRTTGAKADIRVRGNGGSSGNYSLFFAGTVFSTNTGNVMLDGSDDLIVLARSGVTRKTTVTTNNSGPGGDVTIKSAGIDSETGGNLDVSTGGVLSFVPQASQDFSLAQTFPPASSVINTGGLIVGSATNTKALTLGSAVSASGDVKFIGGDQTAAFNITTTSSGNIEFYPTGSFSKSTNVFSAGGDIVVGTKLAPASTATLSTSTLSASGDVRVFSSGSLTQTAGISAGDAVELVSTAGDVFVQKPVSSGLGGILFKASRNVLVTNISMAIDSNGGDLVIWSNASGTGGEVDTGGTLVSFISDGGDIIVGGGADDGANGGTASDGIPDNYVLGGTSSNTSALRLGANMSSGAGNITLRADHGSGSRTNARAAIYLAASVELAATSGNINIVGRQNSGNTSTSNQYGVWLGESSSSLTRAKITTTSGNIYISGESSQSVADNRRGIVLYGVELSAGGDVTLVGTSPDRTGHADILSWTQSVIDAGGDVLLRGSRVSYLELTEITAGNVLKFEVGNLDASSNGLSTASVTYTPLAIKGSGTVVIEPYGASFISTLNLNGVNPDSTITGLTVGKAGNQSAISIGTSKTISGPIAVFADLLTVNSSLNTSSSNSSITLLVDRIAVSSQINAGTGIVSIEPQTSGRGITVAASDSAADLSFTPTELGLLSAGTLRLTTSGDVSINSSVNFSGKVSSLAIRAGGDVTGASGAVLTVDNLGVDAGGTINFPGNQVASVVALNASAVTYNQSADYAVAAVDGIDPEFGYGVKFAISNVPTSGTLDAFMAVAFNPPPTVKILDKFNNVLAANNTSAADFAVTPTMTVVSSSGTPTLAGTTPTRSGGTFTFSSLNVADATAEVTLTFSATRSGVALSENSSFDDGSALTVQAAPTFTTTSYNVQAGEPTSISIALASTSAQAGKTGFGITATLKDVAGNTIASGPHANAAVTVSISGANGTIIAGNTPTTSAGVADFSGLRLGGTVGTNYTLTFSVTFTDTQSQSQTVTQTQVVTLTPGDAAKLSASPATQTKPTGQVLDNVTVQVLDAYDNVVTSSTDPIAVALSTGANGGSATLAGYSNAVAASSGEVVFNTLGINGTADDYTLTFSSGSLTSATASVEITHTVANRIELVMPSSARNDIVLSQQPVVTVYDLYDNVVESFTGEIVLSVDSGSLGGDVDINAVAGIADFAGKAVELIGTAGSKVVTATAASLSMTDTAAVSLSYGLATALEVSTPAAGFVNRVSLSTQPQITVVDSSGNTVEDFAGDIDMSVSGGLNIDGTTTVSITATDAGVAIFSGLSLRGSVGNYTLTFASSSLTSATQAISLTHGAPTQLVITQSASGTRAGQQFDTPIELEIQDADGNLTTTGDGASATIAVSKSAADYPTGATFGGTLSLAATGGVATFTNLTLSGVADDYSLSFEITAPAGLTSITATSETITLLAGAKDSISIVQQPTDSGAGVDFSPVVSVEVLDAWGNRVLADSSSIITAERVNTSNTTNFGTVASVTASQGLATFTGMDIEASGNFKLRFSSTGVANVLSNQFEITHGPASKLVFNTPHTTSARSDVALSPAPVLRLLDQFDNPVVSGPQFTVTATVVSNNSADVLALTGNQVSSTAGTELLIYANLVIKAPEANYKLRYTATDGNDTFYIETADIALGFGLPSQLNISQPAANARAGEAFGTLPIIEIQDSAGNLVANSTLAVTASVSGKTLVGTASKTAAAGVADFAATGLGIAGTVANGLTIEYQIEYPSGSFISATQSIDLAAGPTRFLHINQQPTELVTRETFSPGIEIELRDQYQNKVLSDSSTNVSALLYAANNQVATATAGEPAIQAVVQTAAAGIVDFSALSFAVPPAQGYYLTFSLPGSLDVVTSQTFTVVPGAVASILIDQQPSTTNGDNSLVMTGELLAQMPQVSLYDQDGYLADNAAGSVSVSIASGAAGDLSEGSTSAVIANGVATSAGVKLVGTPLQGATPAESYTLKFSFAGVDSAPSNALSVTHNVAHKLVLQRAAANGMSGEAFATQPIIEIQDRYDNIVESSYAQVRASVSPGNDIRGQQVNANKGVARFTSLSIGGLVSNSYTLSFEIPNTQVTTVQQSGITITHGYANKLVLTTAPASLDANSELTKTGSALATQPVIEVRDGQNNLVLDSSDVISVSLSSPVALDQRDRLENFTVTASGGIATFQNLTLIGRPGQDYRLNFTSGGLTDTQSDLLQVRHADPDSIEIVIQPSSVVDAQANTLTRTGSALHVQPQIRILDFDGNHADSAAGVNVIASVVSGGGTAVTDLDGSGRPFNEAVISGGVADFSELKVVATPGVPQQIQFSATFNGATITSVNSASVTLTNGVAQSLAMHVEPCAGIDDGSSCAAGITGDALQVQPTVKVLDAYGNLVVDHVGNVVASVSASGARLSVADSDDVLLRTVAVSGGYAVFSGLELTATPADNVKLNFASAGLTGVSSRDLVVAAANAASLQMVVQPVGERTGNALSTQPKVRLVDRFGNTVLSDNTTVVTVTASGGNLSLDPAGPLTATANQGVVSFSGLKFTGTPGANYELTFTAANVLPVTSASFSVSNAFANNLVYTSQPVAGKTGDLLTQMPVLELRDFDGNLAADDNSTVVRVSIDVSNGAARFVDSQDQTLGTAPSATAVGGVVQFSGLRIVATPGAVYKLGFEATPSQGPNFSSAASDELVFSHANPAQLVVTQSAIGGLADAALPTQPVLQVKDRFGNNATGDNSTVVTAVIETGAHGAVLRGGQVTAAGGVVTFAELALDGVPAETYTLGFNALSEFGESFRVVDSTELTLSRPASLSLNFTDLAYVPDLQVVPVFTSDSQGLVTWSTTSNPGICVLELDGSNQPTGNVIVKGVGTCSLKAEIARFDYTHASAPQSSYLANEVSANLVISKAAQSTLQVTSADNVNYRGSLTLSVTGGSGTGDIRYFVSGDCRVIGGVLLPGEAGASCEVFARKLGDANYQQIDSATQTITINRIAQSALRIGNSRDVSVGDIVLFTAGGTGTGEVTYQVSTQGTAQCQIIDGNILRATQNGTCGVMATKQQSTNYLLAISPEATFTFSKMSQTVNFTSSAPVRPTPGTLFEPTAQSSSGLAVTITITGGSGTVCEFDSVETTKVRFLTSGNCVLTATQPGSSQFNAASATLTLAVNAMNQTITFGSLQNKIFGEPKFQLSATASSGLPVSFAVGSTFQNLGCSVTSSGMVTLTAAGMCEIVASQAGNASFLPAPDVTQIFSIAPDQAGAPHLVSVSVSNQAITAKFRAPSYLGGSQVSAYRLEATNGDGDTFVNPGCSALGADLVCDLVGMPLNVPYTVRVAAVTAAGIGLYSESSMPVTPGSTEIAVMKLSADQNLSTSELSVSWEKPLALDGNFVSYEVFVWPLNTDQPEEPTQTITSINVESATYTMEPEPEVPQLNIASFSLLSQNIGVPEASSYNLKVVTITDSSTTAMTDVNVASGVQLGLGVPGRPRNEVLEADSQQLRVVWSEPTFDGGSEITHYMIRKAGEEAPPCQAIDPLTAPLTGEVNENWNFSLNSISALLYEQSGLSAGSSYEIAIFACNEVGASAPAILTHSIPAPPPPPAPVVPVVPEEEEEVVVEDETDQREDSVTKPVENVKPAPKPTPSPQEILAPSEDPAPSQPGSETPGPVSPEVAEPEVTAPSEPEVETAAPISDNENSSGDQSLLWLLLVVVLLVIARLLGRRGKSKI